MIEEAYIDFETAKLLKEKGFDAYCIKIYDSDGYLLNNSCGYINEEQPNEYFCSLAPTKQMAMRWLREEKNIIIVVQPEYFNAESKCSWWGCDIWVDDNYERLQGDYPTYEEAVEAAIKYCLENLI